jgi:anaerobic ribonucleoside-triphosphate reductase activating protein
MPTSLPLIADAELTMSIAQVIPCTEAEGPGSRFAIWFQGCPLRCPGCCNPEFLPFKGGESWTLSRMKDSIAEAQEKQQIEGISLLGGEPFAHAKPAAAIARFAQERGLSVMIYSGYLIEELRQRPEPEVAQLLGDTDLLVDGPYIREQPETARRWIGSRNQRVHFFSDRYDPKDPCWQQKNTLEVRLEGQQIVINGFPAVGAVGLWKGWRRK